MLGSEQLDEAHLRSQLETYTLIVEANKGLMDKNISTRAELAAKLTIAQRFLDLLELPGDNADHSTALNKANQIIGEMVRSSRGYCLKTHYRSRHIRPCEVVSDIGKYLDF